MFETMQMMQVLHPPTPAVPTLTASGFGDPASNGVLTQIGTFNGQPLYQAAGGDYVFFTTDGAAPGWRITAQDPNISESNVKYSTNAGNMFPTVITDPWHTFIAGTAPAGSIS